MGINWKKDNKSIAFRITIVHVAIILLVSLSMVLSIGMTLSSYFMQRSYNDLNATANSLVQIVKNTGMRDYALVEALIANNGLSQGDVHVVLMDYRLDVMLSTLPAVFGVETSLPEELKTSVLSGEQRGTYGNYLYVTKEITNRTGDTTGYVLSLSAREEFVVIRNSIFYSVLRIILVAVLLGIVFSGYITRRLIEPLQKLETRIREIESGEFEGELEVEVEDEIGDVTKAFNAMSRQLVQYNQAQSRFIQNASHELKSPLMNIQGYAEGLQDKIFNEEETKEALKIITEESQRLKNVVEELLYISKIDEVYTKVEMTEVSLADVVNDAVRTVYTRINQHNIDLNVLIDDRIILQGNYNYLVRAIANVLDNAVRYTKQRIDIEAKVMENIVRIVTIDDGPGFAEEDLKHIFERFYKGHTGNTGLGMAIVADIVKEHNGKIKALNDTRGGAVIIIDLPLTQLKKG